MRFADPLAQAEIDRLTAELARLYAQDVKADAAAKRNVTPTGKHVKAIADLLSGEYASVEDAAADAIEEAWRLYEQRASYVVVGQLNYSDGEYVPASSVKATKVALGPYGTAGDAKAAGESLAVASGKLETFRWWLLPIHHESPAVWHKARKADRDEAKRTAVDVNEAERIAKAKAFSAEQWTQDSLI